MNVLHLCTNALSSQENKRGNSCTRHSSIRTLDGHRCKDSPHRDDLGGEGRGSPEKYSLRYCDIPKRSAPFNRYKISDFGVKSSFHFLNGVKRRTVIALNTNFVDKFGGFGQ